MTLPPHRIRVLDTTLANQIAAGEVIERPASVLKELLENSLDAGASQIKVVIENGGHALVQVHDNGSGIAAEDLQLALQRHATSKISSLSDLEAIQSLGFRGEALPSIASVSRLTLETCTADTESGWKVQCEEGVFKAPPAPLGHPRGTTLSVRDLFYNTPARRKFLRTERTEFQHIERLFKRIALVCFDVRMELIHDGRSLLRLPVALTAQARNQRVYRLLGKSFSEHAQEFDQQLGGLRLWGWLGASGFFRDRTDLQHLYINRRAVSDSICRHAVRMAYEDLIPAGKQPAWVLNLEIDPGQVDVNVHPAKQEVRFHEARMAHDFIRSAVRAQVSPELLPAVHEDRPVYPFQSQLSGTGSSSVACAPSHSRQAFADTGSRADSAGSKAGVQSLVVLEQRWWLGHVDGNLYIADLRAVAGLLCTEALQHLLHTTQPQSRPLLLPAGFALHDPEAENLPQVWVELRRLGVEVRQSGPDRGMLMAVPLALARVPAEDLARSIETGINSLQHNDRAEDWISHLAASASAHPPLDLHQAGQLLEHLLQIHEVPTRGVWRQVHGAELSSWLQRPA